MLTIRLVFVVALWLGALACLATASPTRITAAGRGRFLAVDLEVVRRVFGPDAADAYVSVLRGAAGILLLLLAVAAVFSG